MAWTQVKPFDQSKATAIKNLCLGNVQRGYSIPGKYNSAWEAWQNTEQHTDPIPSGVDVPVYFSYSATIDNEYKNWGHIGVRLANGKFWSDGVTYNSIADYTKNHSPKYVGWGESVNNVRVIKQGVNMIDESYKDFLRIGHSEVGGWDLHKTHAGDYDKTFLDAWRGKDPREFMMAQWLAGGKYRTNKATWKAFYTKWKDVAPAQAAKIKVLEAKILELEKNSCTTDERTFLDLRKKI